MKSIGHGQIGTNAAPAKGLAPSAMSFHTHHWAAWVGIWVGNCDQCNKLHQVDIAPDSVHRCYVSHGLMTDKPAA